MKAIENRQIKRLKNNCVSNIYVWENASNFLIGPGGDMVPSSIIMRFSMLSRFTFENFQWIIPVTEQSLSEQCNDNDNNGYF